tara:strand:- start:2223 stop:2837 length:615 start_codon:yes stop_codon:yes gene_type:complete
MTTQVIFDTSEWGEYADRIERLRLNLSNIIENFLESLGGLFTERLRSIVLEKGHLWTTTYLQSLNHMVFDVGGTPQLIVGLFPQGEEAAKLDIYWRVLEGGAEPNVRIPKDILLAWSMARFGNTRAGRWVVWKNRQEIGGIAANPILSELFILNDDFRAIGLTGEGEQLFSEAFREMNIGFETFMRQGRQTIVRRDVLGRFARQ